MAAPEKMLKPELIKEVRQLRQAVKLLQRQLEEKKDENGEIKGDVNAPVFFQKQKDGDYFTGIAKVDLNQLTEVQNHGKLRHMGEFRINKYCAHELYNQIYEGEK